MVRKHNLYALIFLAGAGANSVEASFGKMMLNGARTTLRQPGKIISQARTARTNFLNKTKEQRGKMSDKLKHAPKVVIGMGCLGSVAMTTACIRSFRANNMELDLADGAIASGIGFIELGAVSTAGCLMASAAMRAPFGTAAAVGCMGLLYGAYSISRSERQQDKK